MIVLVGRYPVLDVRRDLGKNVISLRPEGTARSRGLDVPSHQPHDDYSLTARADGGLPVPLPDQNCYLIVIPINLR